eukprot:1372797-Amphidinium_carterae.1
MSQAWHELNHRATIEVSEHQRQATVAHQEVEHMSLDAASMAASTQSALSLLRAEASNSIRGVEAIAEQRIVQVEEEAARRCNEELKGWPSLHMRKRCKPLLRSMRTPVEHGLS